MIKTINAAELTYPLPLEYFNFFFSSGTTHYLRVLPFQRWDNDSFESVKETPPPLAQCTGVVRANV